MEEVLSVGSKEDALKLFGPRERFLKLLRSEFDVDVVARGNEVSLEGAADDVETARNVLQELKNRLDQGAEPSEKLLRELIDMEKLERESQERGESVREHAIEGFREGSEVVPRTRGQARYIEVLRDSDVVLCTGPAGTGKTYLAVAMALKSLKEREVERLVLCRPAVEAGEQLGFLPGDMYAKINPYLRPLYDALYDMMGVDQVRRYIQKDIIEILPLAFVRGRTLSDAFIILDEGQNCTVGQMKTFLTRLGTGSRLVVTGDVTQSDLPAVKEGMPVRWSAAEKQRSIPLTLMYPSLNEARMTRAEAWISGAQKKSGLTPGAYVPVSVVLDRTESATLVPRSSLIEAPGDGDHVFTVKDGRLEARSVDVLGHTDDHAAVSGVEPGATVVRNTYLGWARLSSGEKVEAVR